LTEYDAIGFDFEHCLVNFDMVEMAKLVVSIHFKELHRNYKYPVELLKEFDFDKHLGVITSCVVWDLETGFLLKLGKGKKINYAIHGFDPVS
jgi:hypothetical protein